MKSKISACMDGEAGDFGLQGSALQLADDHEAREAWRTYHLVGDVLRGLSATSPDFSARVSRALAEEPTVLAPKKLPATRASARWAALSVAAGIAGVAWVGWMAFAPTVTDRPAMSAKLEARRAAPVAATQKSELARVPPPRAADYLLAHQAYSPRVTLQGMAPYVRMVSESNVRDVKGGK
jgi:sigma-E factor negative regulatory protein RseA